MLLEKLRRLGGESPATFVSIVAMTIDKHAGGHYSTNEDYEAVNTLANKLDKLSEDPKDYLGLQSMVYIIWPKIKKEEGKTMDDICLQTNLLAKELRCFRELPTKRQEELRDVCLDLSKRIKVEENSSYRMGLAA
ncbi:MAG: hypothetical protein NTW17_01100 [Candidatus Pacearchaeota archaeon]|nr:hypothetical protein [Candidatus Pacearchaeota archaeon]